MQHSLHSIGQRPLGNTAQTLHFSHQILLLSSLILFDDILEILHTTHIHHQIYISR